MPGRTTCQPATRCTKDLDCAMGELCLPDPTDPCNSDPTIQCFAAGRQICTATKECTAAADCATDQVCVDDPKDPCLKLGCGRVELLFCEKACPQLGEADCLSRPDCHAVYAQVPGSADMAFGRCE
jgi:hypothetical protein